MPFGVYKSKNNQKEKPVKQVPPPVYPKTPPASVIDIPAPDPVVWNDKNASMRINILVIARSNSQVADLMTAMNETANSSLMKKGLSFYCEEQRQVNFLVSRRNKIVRVLSSSDNPYEDLVEDDASLPTQYEFKFSVSGRQDDSFLLSFTAGTNGQMPTGSYDVVWFLADAPMYEPFGMSGDYLSSQLQAVIQSSAESPAPVSIILTQFEKYGKIRHTDDLFSIEASAYAKITENLRELLGDSLESVSVIPVQCYGSGIYKPEGCFLPLLFSLEKRYKGFTIENHPIITFIKKLNIAQRAEFRRSGVIIERS